MKKAILIFLLLIPVVLATDQLPDKIIWDFNNNGYFTILDDTIYPVSQLTVIGDLLVTGEYLSTSPADIVEGIRIRGVDTGAELTDTVFTGSGTDDFVKIGDYTGTENLNYVFEIDGSETFKWSNNSGSDWYGAGSAISSYQTFTTINYGIQIQWDGSSGHTVGDKWEFTARYTTTPPLINASKVDNTTSFLVDYSGDVNLTGCVNFPDETSICNSTINYTSQLVFGGDLNVSDNLYVNDNLTVYGNLNVSGISYLGSLVLESENITVDNIKSLSDNIIDIRNSTTIHGDLNVTGTSYLGNVTIKAENVTTDNIESISNDGVRFYDHLNMTNLNITNAQYVNRVDFTNITVEASGDIIWTIII